MRRWSRVEADWKSFGLIGLLSCWELLLLGILGCLGFQVVCVEVQVSGLLGHFSPVFLLSNGHDLGTPCLCVFSYQTNQLSTMSLLHMVNIRGILQPMLQLCSSCLFDLQP